MCQRKKGRCKSTSESSPRRPQGAGHGRAGFNLVTASPRQWNIHKLAEVGVSTYNYLYNTHNSRLTTIQTARLLLLTSFLPTAQFICFWSGVATWGSIIHVCWSAENSRQLHHQNLCADACQSMAKNLGSKNFNIQIIYRNRTRTGNNKKRHQHQHHAKHNHDGLQWIQSLLSLIPCKVWHLTTSYCWWFRNPKQPPGMFFKPCKSWGYFTISTGEFAGFLVAINSRNHMIPSPKSCQDTFTTLLTGFIACQQKPGMESERFVKNPPGIFHQGLELTLRINGWKPGSLNI